MANNCKIRKITKKYKGYYFEFIGNNGWFKVSAKEFNSYWYQNNTSVIVAYKNMNRLNNIFKNIVCEKILNEYNEFNEKK